MTSCKCRWLQSSSSSSRFREVILTRRMAKIQRLNNSKIYRITSLFVKLKRSRSRLSANNSSMNLRPVTFNKTQTTKAPITLATAQKKKRSTKGLWRRHLQGALKDRCREEILKSLAIRRSKSSLRIRSIREVRSNRLSPKGKRLVVCQATTSSFLISPTAYYRHHVLSTDSSRQNKNRLKDVTLDSKPRNDRLYRLMSMPKAQRVNKTRQSTGSPQIISSHSLLTASAEDGPSHKLSFILDSNSRHFYSPK